MVSEAVGWCAPDAQLPASRSAGAPPITLHFLRISNQMMMNLIHLDHSLHFSTTGTARLRRDVSLSFTSSSLLISFVTVPP